MSMDFGLEINWEKNKIQTISDYLSSQLPSTAAGDEREVVEAFTYLDSDTWHFQQGVY